MRNTWRQLFRRLAAGCIISGSAAWSSAICYAVQIANDTASDPVYASGWAEGQNGGSGFTAWNFESGYFWPYDNGGTNVFYAYNQNIHTIDNGLKAGSQFSNPFNNIGRSWDAAIVSDGARNDGTPQFTLPRGGRGFSSALKAGDTFSVTIDNPTERKHFGGYAIRLNGNTGGQHGSICYGGRPCHYVPDPAHPGEWIAAADPMPKLNVQIFNNANCPSGTCLPGDPRARWSVSGDTTTVTPITDLDSAAGGMRIDVTLDAVNPNAYSVTLTPLANPGAASTVTGTFDNPDVPIDWFQFDNFNGVKSDSGMPPAAGDFNDNGKADAADYAIWRDKDGAETLLPNDADLGMPIGADHYDLWRSNFGTMAGPITTATDLYIRSMTISDNAGSGLGSGAVPEPGTCVYLVAAAASIVVRGARRRS